MGDSLSQLKHITPKVSDGCVYFIDAHISGCDSSWNNHIRVPLIEELDIILSNNIGPSVFIFDDVRLWKTNQAHDWSHISNDLILSKFELKNIQVFTSYEKDDRFYVFTI